MDTGKGERTKALRKALGFKRQLDMAESFGVQRNQINQAETGVRDLPKKVRDKLVSDYKVNLAWLDYGTGEMMAQESDPLKSGSLSSILIASAKEARQKLDEHIQLLERIDSLIKK